MTALFQVRAAVLALLAAAPALVVAGEFSVTPVRIFMTPRDRAVAITVTNEGDTEIVMQAELFTWKQKPNGEDLLTPTEDLILSPPILKLAAKSRQVVRLARLTPPPAGQEQTYRLIVREVPEASKTQDMQVQFALAFSLPVFITPPGAKRQLDCVASRTAPDAVNAVCENLGTAYAQARELQLQSTTGEKIAARDLGGYVLPETKRTFEIKRPGGAKIPGGKLTLKVTLDDGSQQAFDATLPE